MKVFISSTCYDLIDLRAEVAEFLKQGGIEPILSEDLDSGFELLPSKNSIQTCLANVANADAVIVILSSRYGQSLKKAGFDDVSATHLEYLEARSLKKPIFMYIRDRLEGDFGIWQSNQSGDVKFAWYKEANPKMFEWMAAHRKLVKDGGGNWFYLFRDSLELKRRLARDFKATFSNSLAEALLKQGRVPTFDIDCLAAGIGGDSRDYVVSIKNLSQTAAVYPEFKFDRESSSAKLTSLLPGELIEHKFAWVVDPGDLHLTWTLKYSILEGHQFEEKGAFLIKKSAELLPTIEVIRSKRKYLQADPIMQLEV